MEHVGAAAKQPVGYPDIHGGAQKPAGPLVYSLEPHQKEKKKKSDEIEREERVQTDGILHERTVPGRSC